MDLFTTENLNKFKCRRVKFLRRKEKKFVVNEAL